MCLDACVILSKQHRMATVAPHDSHLKLMMSPQEIESFLEDINESRKDSLEYLRFLVTIEQTTFLPQKMYDLKKETVKAIVHKSTRWCAFVRRSAPCWVFGLRRIMELLQPCGTATRLLDVYKTHIQRRENLRSAFDPYIRTSGDDLMQEALVSIKGRWAAMLVEHDISTANVYLRHAASTAVAHMSKEDALKVRENVRAIKKDVRAIIKHFPQAASSLGTVMKTMLHKQQTKGGDGSEPPCKKPHSIDETEVCV